MDAHRRAILFSIAKQLKSERLRRGLDATTLSFEMGYASNTIYRLESGQHNTSFATVVDYANALGYELRLCQLAKEPQDAL